MEGARSMEGLRKIFPQKDLCKDAISVGSSVEVPSGRRVEGIDMVVSGWDGGRKKDAEHCSPERMSESNLAACFRESRRSR